MKTVLIIDLLSNGDLYRQMKHVWCDGGTVPVQCSGVREWNFIMMANLYIELNLLALKSYNYPNM